MRFKIFDVFANKPFEGNPTAVVYYSRDFNKKKMQGIANELSVPDTIFIKQLSDTALLFTSLAFSPYEELKICGQGIVGGIFSILEDKNLAVGVYEIETAIGRLRCFIESRNNPVVFTSLGKPVLSDANSIDPSRIQMLGNIGKRFLRMCFVDLGRKRLVIEVPVDILKEVELERSNVMNLCRELGITGIVFFSQKSKNVNLFRSRHFTTSLNGMEDAVTGGTTGAILAFCNHVGIKYNESPIIVHQGGFNTRDGYVYAKMDKTNREILVGGKAIKIIEGNIYC